ncbi:MAG: DUF2628 domain-containing protein [Pseudomonadota bacterium]
MSIHEPENPPHPDPSHNQGSVPPGGKRSVGQDGWQDDQFASTAGPAGSGAAGREAPGAGAADGKHAGGSSGSASSTNSAGFTGSTADPAPDNLAGQAFQDYVFSNRMADWLLVFVDRNPKPFAATYQRMRKAGRTHVISWSTSAFLLSFAWFFYRRMWLMGFLFLALPAVMFQLSPDLGNGILLATPFLAGLSAKTLYLNQAFRTIHHIDRRPLAPTAKRDAIQDRGGVAYLAGLLGVSVMMMIWGMTLMFVVGDLSATEMNAIIQRFPGFSTPAPIFGQ